MTEVSRNVTGQVVDTAASYVAHINEIQRSELADTQDSVIE